jgi:ADP-heptose:LPS heptosyltransferase
LKASKNVIKSKPLNLEELIEEIDKTEFGIFMDSGPLHLAKIKNIRGILIESSINSNKLLNQFNSISVYKNNYHSKFCSKTCGLVNIFNYNNTFGCYDSLNVSKQVILDLDDLNQLQRGAIKKSYINFIDNPVNCLKEINFKKLIKYINKKIS